MKKDISILKIVFLVTILLFLVDVFIGFCSGFLDFPDTIPFNFFSDLVSAIVYISVLHYAAKGFFNENIFDTFNNNIGTWKIFLFGLFALYLLLNI